MLYTRYCSKPVTDLITFIFSSIVQIKILRLREPFHAESTTNKTRTQQTESFLIPNSSFYYNLSNYKSI